MFICQIAGPAVKHRFTCSGCGKSVDIKLGMFWGGMPEGWSLVRYYPASIHSSPEPEPFKHYICSKECISTALDNVREKMERDFREYESRVNV